MRNHHDRSSRATGVARFSRLLFPAVVWLLGTAVSAADAPAQPPSGAVIHLTDGGFATGELKDSARPGVLRWHATSFVAPFDIAISGVNAIHWPPPATLPKPDGEYCFELAGGDVVFGSLVSLNDQEAELDIARVGRF